MIEDVPILSVNIKIWKFCSFILSHPHNWKCYVFVIPVCIMNALQFIYLYKEWGNLDVFILHTFYTVSVFNALLRTFLVIKKKAQFETFLLELEELYNEMQLYGDDYIQNLLKDATNRARKISIFNFTAALLDVMAILSYPLFMNNKVHPFGVSFPGVDMTASPLYEITYILEVPPSYIVILMYMPFVSLFASFAMFGTALLKNLQYRLVNIYSPGKTDEQIFNDVISCVIYHGKIIRYVREFNALVTYICFAEFLLFGAVLCSLLFCLNIIHTWIHIVNIIMFILTTLYVLINYYWHANELLIQSLKVAEAAYNSEWYNCSIKVRKALILLIIRSQSPLQIMVGNIYPMTLETFQTILNASYSYFTILRGVYN